MRSDKNVPIRIYHKKNFAFGLFCLFLFLANLLMNKKPFDWADVTLLVALFLFGIHSLIRSLSRTKSEEDYIEEQDERNRLVNHKARSMAFLVLRWSSFGLMLACLIWGKMLSQTALVGAGIGLGAIFSLSVFVETVCWAYYDSRE